MIISGNRNKDLAHALSKIYPDAVYCSRETGYELTNSKDRDRFAQEAINHDVIILCSALWQFEQTVLLDAVHKACLKQEKQAHIVCVGSTTDRTSKGTTWLYNAEKKALRDYCNSLALVGVWHSGPKVSYISFGTLSNNQHKHPDRKCMDIDEAAQYIKWLIDQPKYVNINEISIDPMQPDCWND
jgi:short-subunit dehydrogenase